MTDNFIHLGESETLKLEIVTKDGEKTGEYLEFDLEDIELPLKYQDMLEQSKKAQEHLRNQFLMIDKRQDVKGKKLLSRNEEDKVRAMQDFYKKEVDILNMFLGENGVQKLLNGRKVGWSTLDEIAELIDKQIAPHLKVDIERITKKVKDKYKNTVEKQKEVLKADE